MHYSGYISSFVNNSNGYAQFFFFNNKARGIIVIIITKRGVCIEY